MSANEIKQQLHMMHNPFSDATKQPKIPDGKANDSVGFSQQNVTEIRNIASQDVMHVLLYPGVNSSAVFLNGTDGIDGALTRNFEVVGFSQGAALDWSLLTSPATTVDIKLSEDWAMWRAVSAGMQLKLLNSHEEDDGWWEACRITTELDPSDWRFATVNNSSDRANQGTLTPLGLVLGALASNNIANLPTYSTGLLRDLHRVQFEVHGQKDDHDFIHMRDRIRLTNVDYASYVAASETAALINGDDPPIGVINQYTDQSMDMVYLRLRCRPNTGTSPDLGSRFHVNVVNNLEVVWDHSERESRYHTKSHDLGPMIDLHQQALREQQMAAQIIPN